VNPTFVCLGFIDSMLLISSFTNHVICFFFFFFPTLALCLNEVNHSLIFSSV
jgi:hypothetical protein